MSESERDASAEAAAWKPLDRHARRVLGVLVEKAKTTPDNYPMTVAAIVAGSNQKSNRSPQMQLDEDDVVDALEKLRGCGAAREIQGSGRVNKYRHLAYEWLGVNSPQAAVMTELLLRGPQTAGELRSRASRMEPFSSLEALGTTLDELQQKGLVVPLTPAGRGQLFSHALYQSEELRRLRSEAGGEDIEPLLSAGHSQSGSSSGGSNAPAEGFTARSAGGAVAEAAGGENFRPGEQDTRLAELQAELQKLRDRVARLEREVGLEEEG
ncbi:DUF480 domain-containing protein [Candidatus Laterigemmans baculatus]|uniref:DUF480 domain-containing protein n=1 Tax=Candidatus Laterigemmans baculatus TaxID=2770505 RepID=UPI0013DAF9D3|nr:YceH family protein [Candidatus Laterigemmans baculatus]